MSQVIQDAIDKKREVEGLINGVFDAVNEVLSWIPDALSHLIEPIMRGVENLRSKVNELWGKATEFYNNTGQPDKIQDLAAQWAEVVAYPIGDVASMVTLEKLKSHIEWEGRAAEAYQSTIPAQVSALNAMKDLSLQMRDSLDNLSNAIRNFWLVVISILTGLGIAAVAAGLGAASVVGTPAALGILAGAVGAAVGAIFAGVTVAENTMDTILQQQKAIMDKVHQLGEQWSRTNIGSMSHKSDWEIE